MSKEKFKDLILISGIFLVSALVIIILKIGYLGGVLIFFGVPAIYLSVKNKKLIKKSATFSAIFVLPLTVIIDYITHVSKVWYEFSESGIRILEAFPLEAFLWSFTYMYFIVVFYEYFFDKDKNKNKISKNIRYLVFANTLLMFSFALIYFFNKELLIINYFYAILILVLFFIPIIFMTYNSPSLIKKISIQGFYFFFLSIAYELIALRLGHWTFGQGKYIGWVEISSFGFPLEEFIWLIFAVPAGICIYEFFADDEK